MLRWIVNFMVTSTLRSVHNWAVDHIIVVELELSHGDVINTPIMDTS
jgi:hypothetical protein